MVLSHDDLSPKPSRIDPTFSRIDPPISRCMPTTVEEQELGPEQTDNPIVKKFLGGHITNNWRILLKKTMVYFQWMVKTIRNRPGDETMSAYHMAMMF